jgi:hypothetical protein
MADLLQDTSDDNNEDGGDVDEEALKDPDIAKLFEAIPNRHDHDDVLFGSPRWLQNFREMKQAAIDDLYPDNSKCLRNTSVLRFILQMLMLKARHGCIDTGFNDLLRILGETLPEGNKVPANNYQAKKLVKLVAMKLKKFHACPNHCILYQDKYEKMQSYPHCGAIWYKGNADCRANMDEDRGLKKKKTVRKTASKKPQNSLPAKDEEEEGYT